MGRSHLHEKELVQVNEPVAIDVHLFEHAQHVGLVVRRPDTLTHEEHQPADAGEALEACMVVRGREKVVGDGGRSHLQKSANSSTPSWSLSAVGRERTR